MRAAGNADGARELPDRVAPFPDGYLHQTVAAWETLAERPALSGTSEVVQTDAS